jgi:AraC-like DNA-binding protein
MVLLDHGGRHPSEVTVIAPPHDLTGVAEHLWIQGPHGAVKEWRVVADASPYLIASVTDCGGTRRLRVGLVGARTHAAAIDVTSRVLTVGVRFKAGVLPSITGEPAHAFVDRSVLIDDVFPRTILADLQLGSDAPPRVLAREIVRLLRRLRREDRNPVIPYMSRPATVRELAAWLEMAPRSLHDHMRGEVGLGPKRLLRVLRLHAALRARWSGGLSWAAVAYATGFADQAHLTREVRALLGETPSAWASRGSAVSFKTPLRSGR